MKKQFTYALILVAMLILTVVSSALAGGGPDEFGYNNKARNFVGTCVSWHMGKFNSTTGQAEAYCGDYSTDKLKMKWTSEWDRGNAEGWSDSNGYAGAWTDNQWNGMFPGGSGETWHYKIAWNAGCAEGNTPTNANKGDAYCIWGPFAMLMSHGTIDGSHYWDVLLAPAGYGH